MQCKDIANEPILLLLDKMDGKWATWFNYPGIHNSVIPAFPVNTPVKLVLAKMRSLINLGLVDGCSCGCRGDYVITEKGKASIRGKEGM